MEEYFNKSLSRFIKDFACKDEIVAKLKSKKPISQITRELTFKISEESVVGIIWDYLIENNIILLYDIDSKDNEQYDYVKRVSDLGKTEYVAVKKSVPIDKSDYRLVDIKKIRSSENELKALNDFERELIEKLPFKDKEYYILGTFL